MSLGPSQPRLAEVDRNLTSGGWVEFQELDLRYYSQDDTLTNEQWRVSAASITHV